MYVFLVSPLLLVFGLGDPSQSMTRSKASSRALECERMTAQAAAQVRPGEIKQPKPRGDGLERSVLICTERLIQPGVRSPRDEGVLADLDVRVSELATAAHAARPELQTSTWMVETHYPSAQVASKIAFATKIALMELGLSVSDRVPMVGAGDIDVITRMPPQEAYPAACRRYAENGTLRDGDTLLAVISYDPRATTLHAGLCRDGQWTWLR